MPAECLKYDMLTEVVLMDLCLFFLSYVVLYPLTLLPTHIFATCRSLAHRHGGLSRDVES